MAIRGLSNLHFNQQFVAAPGPDGKTIRIGRNEACTKLSALEKKLRPAVEQFESDMEQINNDKNLSETGKQAKRAERISQFNLQAQQLRADATAHAEALRTEADAIRAKTKGNFAPQDPGEKYEAVELRNLLRSMTAEQRTQTIIKTLAEGDKTMLKALSNLQSWDTTIVSSEPLRKIVAEAITKAENEAMDPQDFVAVDNAQALLANVGNKLKAFDTEVQRITEGRQS